MCRVAALFDEDRLLEVGLPRLLEHLANVRSTVGDLATMRAIHFLTEDQRVQRQTVALQEGKFQAFARMARESGTSSAMFLQNVSPKGEGCDALQPAMAIQALCAALLGEEGAWRIHGGGFGGSVLAIVPQSHARAFATTMNQALGYEACSPSPSTPKVSKCSASEQRQKSHRHQLQASSEWITGGAPRRTRGLLAPPYARGIVRQSGP